MKSGMDSVAGAAAALALLLTSPASAGGLVTLQDAAAQTTTASTVTPSSDPQLASVVPQGREIPVDEAEQLRGGKIKVAVVILRQGRNLVMRVIDCTSSSACRNEAARRFGKGMVEAVFYDTLLGAAQRQACRSGFRSAC